MCYNRNSIYPCSESPLFVDMSHPVCDIHSARNEYQRKLIIRLLKRVHKIQMIERADYGNRTSKCASESDSSSKFNTAQNQRICGVLCSQVETLRMALF